jgi:tripartite-type tricarboxylate transporter receptor subunit TctC
MNRREWILSAVASSWAGQASSASDWPTRPIRIIYNFAPGGAGDATLRYLAQQLGASLGQPVIVDNRTGGNGAVGIITAARAAADGYTLLFTPTTGIVQVPFVTKDASFDPARSIVPLGQVATTPLVLLAHPSVPADDFPGFVDWARHQPAGVDVAGAGPITEVTTALLARDAKIKLVFVAYRGAGPALQALMAGEVKAYVNTPNAGTAEYVKAGKVKVIGVTSAQPSPLVPGGKPISAFVPGLVQEINFAFWAPPGIPVEASAKFQEALKKVLAEPGLADRFYAQGLILQPAGAEVVSQAVLRTSDTIRKLVQVGAVKFD